MSEVPERILQVAQTIHAEGGRALLVGGCVRDRLMGHDPKDWDVEVYGVEPSRLRELLERFGQVNGVGGCGRPQLERRLRLKLRLETCVPVGQSDWRGWPGGGFWGEGERFLLGARQPSLGRKWVGDLGALGPSFPVLHTWMGVPRMM